MLRVIALVAVALCVVRLAWRIGRLAIKAIAVLIAVAIGVSLA